MSVTCPTCGEPLSTREGDDGTCPRCASREQPTLSPPLPFESATLPPAVPAEAATLAPESVVSTTAPTRSPPGFEILDELGRGGMGVVYKARQLSLGRIVALKMILSGGHAAAGEMQRFRTEAEAIARLQHPNIVQVFEIGEHDGLPFITLEYCGGGSLDRKLAGIPIPPREAAALVKTLAEAMQAAHSANVIHRDLKPANVLLGAVSGQPSAVSQAEGGSASLLDADRCSLTAPKITDFGLAKKLDEQGQSVTGSVMGTPSYMAPEQAEAKKDIGPPADIYSLGAILYECLTGRPPFRAATAMDTLMQLLTEEPAPPRSLVPNVPRDLETICLKCLEKGPSLRYGSAQALADDLRRFLADEPIEASRPGLIERAWRRLRKQGRQVVVTAAVSVGVVLLVLAGMLALGGYAESQMGELELSNDGPVLTAEVLRDDDSLVTRFRAPTVDPVRIQPGTYRLRLSAPGWPSEEANLLIAAAGKHSFDATILPRELWPAVRATVFGRYGTVTMRRDPIPVYLRDRTDLVLVRDNQVVRVHGKTGRETVLAFPEFTSNLANYPWPDEFRHDLDGDGEADVVYVGRYGRVYRLDHKPIEKETPGNIEKRVLIGMVPTGKRSDPIVVTARVNGERCVERLDSNSKVLWKADLPRSGGLWDVHSLAPRVALSKVSGKDALLVAGPSPSFVVALDPATGARLTPFFDRPGKDGGNRSPAVFVDLDGDGNIDVVWGPSESNLSSTTLTAFSPTSGAVLWERTDRRQLLALVRTKSGTDVIVQSEGPSRAWSAVERLSGRDGSQLWQARIARQTRGYSRNFRALVGPDLDGDGEPDLFVASRAYSGRSDRASIHLHALSGSTGETRWYRQDSSSGDSDVARLVFWPGGPAGWPRLVVATELGAKVAVQVRDGGDGRLLHRIPDARQPVVFDLDGDGLPELCYQTSTFQSSGGEFALREGEPGSIVSVEKTGLFRVIRGTPPAQWRWMGKWEAIHDLDGDGLPDVLRREKDGTLAAASGRTGRRLWQDLWTAPPATTSSTALPRLAAANSVVSLPPAASGQPPELLVVDPSRKSLLAPRENQLVFPLRAVDGATGEDRWIAGAAKIDGSMTITMQRSPITATSPPVRVSDGEEDWIIVRTQGRLHREGNRPLERTFLVLLSSDGKPRWAKPLFDGPLGNDAVWNNSAPPRVALAGPPDHRIVLHLGRRLQTTASGPLLLQAYRLDTGEKAWELVREGFGGGYRLGIAVLPGKRELALLRIEDSVTAFDTTTFAEVWKYSPIVGRPASGEWVAPVVLPKAGAAPLVVLDTARHLVALDDAGKLVGSRERDPNQSVRLEVADLTGDGSSALVVSSTTGISAYRGGVEAKHELWSWRPPGDSPVTLIEVARPGEGPASIVVRVRDNELVGLDGVTGKVKWRMPSEGAGQSQILDVRKDSASLLHIWPGKQTVCRAVLPQSESGRAILPTPEPREYTPPRDDPRTARPLPWRESGLELTGERAVEVLLAPVVTLFALVLPCWLFYQAARRASWRRFLIWLTYVGLAYLGVKLIVPEVGLAFGWHEARSDTLGLWMGMLGVSLLGAPVLALLWTVGVAVLRRRFSWLVWVAALWLVCCLGLSGIMLYFDSQNLDIEQRYIWDGWYGLWRLGLYLASVILAALWVGWALVLVVKGKRRKKPA